MVNVSTLPETNSSHLKMDGWNTIFLLGLPVFRGENVSFRKYKLGGGFKYFLFSPLLGEDSHFD